METRDGKDNMEKKIKKVLVGSFLVIICVCVLVFVMLATLMGRKTKESVSEVSDIYMLEVSKQIQQEFHLFVSMHLELIERIIEEMPEESAQYGSEMLNELQKSAERRNFVYLGFYTEAGEMESVYGGDVEIADGDHDRVPQQEDGNVIMWGVNEKGESLLLLGKPANYPLKDGTRSVLLLTGIYMDTLNEAFLGKNLGTNTYSYVIDTDGTIITGRDDEYKGQDYFERIEEKFEELRGKSADQYVEELKSAMDNEEEYRAKIMLDGKERYIYCCPLPGKATWYLITVMRDEVWDAPIVDLDKSRTFMIVVCMLVILACMLAVFVLYFRLSQRHLRELDSLRQEAEQANKAKSDFLSSISHDIRTPMNAILGMTEIALKNKQDEVRVEDCLNKINLSGKQLLGLINDVLDMSKIENEKMVMDVKLVSLRETMEDIVNIVRPQIKAGNQYFDIYAQNILSENIYCDGTRLNQILLNLLSNAVKFTPEGGRIDVHVYQEESPMGTDYVRTHLLVEDTGIGMSQEFQKNIFDTFTRESSEKVQNIEGTGLGMAITKSIVDMLRGTIEVESEIGKGSSFHVTLDLKKAEEETEMVLPEWNVLVVDDNEQLCISAANNLGELGVHADWTVDGREAIQMIEEKHEKNDDYQFVLVDWKMPKMDGLQTVRRIREKVGKEIPVFLISAYDWSDIEGYARDADIEGFISKPLFKSTLYFRLAGYAEGEKDKPAEIQSKEIDFTGKRILLAEDIDINWEIANEILSLYGFEVERAVNGKECVEMFEASETGFYDAILMDLRMPVMNGYEATKAIRASNRQDKKLPIIAMTANAFLSDIQECLDCGMDAHVAKPLNVKEFIDVLQRFIGN